MLQTINGLPAHILLIHVIIVLAPLGALFTVLSAVWPAARARIGFVAPLTCLITLVFVPITTSAGHWLRNEIDPGHQNPSITKHANLGSSFLYFALGLFVVSVAVWLLGRRYDYGLIGVPHRDDVAEPTGAGGGVAVQARSRPATTRTALSLMGSVAVAAVAVIVSAVAVWQLYRIGDSGAHAVWDGIIRH
jgi:hypothetical protein